MRLDVAIAERGLARSRNRAAELIAAGQILLNGHRASKASTKVEPTDQIEVTGVSYVARSAGKLKGALDDFGISGFRICIDAGASTGGFTQLLLERGAERVFAIDVGTGQLSEELTGDSRVVNLENTDIREFRPEQHGLEPTEVDLLVADLSFISLSKVAASFAALVPSGNLVALIKPQFELSRGELTSQGLVRSKDSQRRAIASALEALGAQGFGLLGLVASSVKGSSGNQEFLVHAKLGANGLDSEHLIGRIAL